MISIKIGWSWVDMALVKFLHATFNKLMSLHLESSSWIPPLWMNMIMFLVVTWGKAWFLVEEIIIL
jgi:hypothetical protein